MKTRMYILFFAVIITSTIFVGCSASLGLGTYENTLTVVNATTKLDDGKITILTNGRISGNVFNQKDSHNTLTLSLWGGFFSNVYVSREFSILAMGTVNGKTVAVERKMYAGTMQRHHEAWIITDGMLQPFTGF